MTLKNSIFEFVGEVHKVDFCLNAISTEFYEILFWKIYSKYNWEVKVQKNLPKNELWGIYDDRLKSPVLKVFGYLFYSTLKWLKALLSLSSGVGLSTDTATKTQIIGSNKQGKDDRWHKFLEEDYRASCLWLKIRERIRRVFTYSIFKLTKPM